MSDKKKIVIVGGVAGGASAAARARRLSESAEILMVERGPHVSFANCGLPYFIGGEIVEESKLLQQTPQAFLDRMNINVLTETEALSVDAQAREVELRDLRSGRIWRERYDDLVLSPGAAPIRPPIEGIEMPGHFTLRNVPDSQRIKDWVAQNDAKSAVVIGAGFIGLEMVEQFVRLGLKVSLVELMPQVLPPLDVEMAAFVQEEVEKNGAEVIINDAVVKFEKSDDAKASIVITKEGRRLPADVVIIGVGVRPETMLAKSAGAEIGALGGIRVDEYMRTTAPNVWAVGDAVEIIDEITGTWSRLPLAGPANRQGRLVADNVFGAKKKWGGTLGTAIVRVFELSAASTGASEKVLQRANVEYRAVHIHRPDHASYYPGAKMLHLKLIWSPMSGRILGAQAVGAIGVDKRIDVLATAIRARMTVDQLAELELTYAPPFGAAKDPVNIAGQVAQNIQNGNMEMVHWHELDAKRAEGALVLDVRSEAERQRKALEDTVHIPLEELRGRVDELPRDREIIVHCQSGQRSYYACRILNQQGFNAKNLSGALLTWETAMRGRQRELAK